MTSISASSLAERLCRPQRLGLFGHRGVGKTTLLTMLYREAVAGRLPELRLAAGDAPTANYLADKVLQLESGAVLPATLAETALHVQLYHGSTRLELIVKDYQGEQVAVGRQEPIREFLQDCDAVWLCFDPALLDSRAARLHGEQEAEQVVEDYLKLDRGDCPHRPMALVLTKCDLLPPRPEGITEELWLTDLTRDAFSMTLHALKQHAPSNSLFAVSSLGPSTAGQPRTVLSPRNLERPLLWLVEALRTQDEARLDRLFELAPSKIALLERCVRCYTQRYPGSPRLPEYQARLRLARSRRRRVRSLVAVSLAAFVTLGLWAIDTLSFHQARAFEQSSDDLGAARARWETHASSPLNIFSRQAALKRERDLKAREYEQKRDESLAELRRLADNPLTSTSRVRRKLKEFLNEYPSTEGADRLCAEIDGKIYTLRSREAQAALDDLIKSEHASAGAKGSDAARKHLVDLVARADRNIEEFGDTATAARMRERRTAYLHRIDEHDFGEARSYSRREPTNFDTRRARYGEYLKWHPKGAFTAEAEAAIREIEVAWDRYDFRRVREVFVKNPAEFDELIKRCNHYLNAHDKGKFRDKASEIRAWAGRVNGSREYTVKLVRGDFPRKIGRWYTYGPSLAVTIEVNGITHGPSPIIKNNYDPQWDYEFPRTVTWKPGDSVRIIVRDHAGYLGRRTVLDHSSGDDDRLAMRLLSGKFEVDDEALWFESDFNMPSVPDID